jgi:hypothetical protein
MLDALLRMVRIGCAHRDTTFPLTANGTRRTYVVCLGCGKEFAYNWQDMRRGAPLDARGNGTSLNGAPEARNSAAATMRPA